MTIRDETLIKHWVTSILAKTADTPCAFSHFPFTGTTKKNSETKVNEKRKRNQWKKNWVQGIIRSAMPIKCGRM